MAAILFYNTDLISLQSWLKWGPNMLAISNPKRTINACNLFENGQNMLAISKIVLRSRDYDFWIIIAKHIVRAKFEIASIFSLLWNLDCRSILWPRLQEYSVSVIKICNHMWSIPKGYMIWQPSYIINLSMTLGIIEHTKIVMSCLKWTELQ